MSEARKEKKKAEELARRREQEARQRGPEAPAPARLPQLGSLAAPELSSLAAPELGACTPSACAWRLSAARHSQEEAGPLGAQPPPRALEPAASKGADFAAWPPRLLFISRLPPPRRGR